MIYFIRDESTDRIKIGTTIRLSQRLYQLGLVTAGPLHVLAVIPGSYADESVLHQRFRSIRDDGEWFKSEAELLDFIATEGQPWDESLDAPFPDGGEPKRSLASIKGGEEFARWLTGLADHSHLPVAILIEHAIREYAERHGFDRPQPKR